MSGQPYPIPVDPAGIKAIASQWREFCVFGVFTTASWVFLAFTGLQMLNSDSFTFTLAGYAFLALCVLYAAWGTNILVQACKNAAYAAKLASIDLEAQRNIDL